MLITQGISPSAPITQTTTASVAKSILSILANKHKLESEDVLLASIEKTLSGAVSNASESNLKAVTETIVSIFAVAAGFFRRYTGAKIQPLVSLIRDIPRNPIIGFSLARRLEVIMAPQRFLTKDDFAVVRPLWTQKLYFELVKPLLEGATDRELEPLVRSSCGVAVLVAVRHTSLSIYEEDLDKILRVAIATSQNLGTGLDTLAALTVIKSVLGEAPEKAEDHIRSLITICNNSFASATAAQARPEWLPASVQSARISPAVSAQAGKLSLEILSGLPRLFESRHLLSFVGDVDRQLSIACGNRSRDVRTAARTARTAWSEVN